MVRYTALDTSSLRDVYTSSDASVLVDQLHHALWGVALARSGESEAEAGDQIAKVALVDARCEDIPEKVAAAAQFPSLGKPRLVAGLPAGAACAPPAPRQPAGLAPSRPTPLRNPHGCRAAEEAADGARQCPVTAATQGHCLILGHAARSGAQRWARTHPLTLLPSPHRTPTRPAQAPPLRRACHGCRRHVPAEPRAPAGQFQASH